MKKNINIYGARQNNLKNITVHIPKNNIVVFTGVSGSGKSSLVFETIGAEAQRQINETQSSFARNRLQHYGVADVDKIDNLNVPVIINQKPMGGNVRSTVATVTDVYAVLRLLYSRMGTPFAGYSNVFSFNHPNGMCPECEGLGFRQTIDIFKILNTEKSLNEGPIDFPTYQPHAWRWTRYADSGYFDLDKKLKDYTPEEWELFLNAPMHKPKHPTPQWKKTALYEGIIVRFRRNFLRGDSEEQRYRAILKNIIKTEPCPLCKGARLNRKTLSCTIKGLNIADCCALSVDDLADFIATLHDEKLSTVLSEITVKLSGLRQVGLGYLTLNRMSSTLSGGESQRIKMVKHLNSSLVDMLYIFDEPSIGLHPADIEHITAIIRKIKEKGNSILLVEHDPDFIKIADHIVDMGPGSGVRGGEVIYQGSFADIGSSPGPTGAYFSRSNQYKKLPRTGSGNISIRHADNFNLNNIDVDIPRNCMVVVTGVAGSGKSTLMGKVLPQQHPEVIVVDQSPIMAGIRSNLLTYLDLSDTVRHLFAKANGVKASRFSYNSEGACPNCKGTGIEKTELAFLDDVETVCDVCSGSGYNPDIMKYTYLGKNTAEVMAMTVREAAAFFDVAAMREKFDLLADLGLDYMALGQRLNSFSGGERQRLKLTENLDENGHIYVLDEPASGLHPADTDKLLAVLDRIVDKGNSVIVIEHNLDIMAQADWIIDIGPGAGNKGGNLVFQGTVENILKDKTSVTGRYLADYLREGY